MNQKISIVTVCYNAENEIEKTMRSVLSQNYDNIEYIIIDGVSTDNTLEIVKSVASDFPSQKVRIFSSPDKGIFDAMNKGIERVTGEWINFMNAGDIFYDENVIAKMFPHEYPECVGVLFGDTCTEKGLLKMKPFIYSTHQFCEMGICHQSLFVRTLLAKKYPFDLKFKVAADYNMIRKIYDAGFELRKINIPVSVYDLYGYSVQNAIRQIDEIAIICNKYHSLSHYKARIIKQLKSLIKRILRK